MAGPFKMKGFSPFTKKTDPKKLTADSVSGLEGAGKSGGEEHFVDLDESKQKTELQKSKNPTEALTAKYGGTWAMGTRKTPYNTSTGTKFEERRMLLNQDGLNPTEVGNNAATDRAKALKE